MFIYLQINPEKDIWTAFGALEALGFKPAAVVDGRPLEELLVRIEPAHKDRFLDFLVTSPDDRRTQVCFKSMPLQITTDASAVYQPFIIEGYFVTQQGQQEPEFLGVLRKEIAEANLDQILNFSGDMLALLDTNLCFRKLNNAYAEMFGKTPREMIGSSIVEAFSHDEDHYQTVIGPILEKCLNNEPTQFKQWVDVPGMGKTHLTIQYSPVCDEYGNVDSIAVVCQNTTEIMRSVEALEQSEEMLRINEEIAELGGWSYHVATEEMHWTDQIYKIHGVDNAFMPSNETLRSHFSEDDWALLQSNLQHNLKGEKTESVVELKTPEGIRKWVRILSFPLVGEDGSIAVIRGILQDQTDIIAAEKELESQKVMFEALAETSRDLISRFDITGRHIYINSAITAYTGEDKSFYIGKTHKECNLLPRALDFWEGLLKKTTTQRTPTSALLTLKDVNGETVTFDCRMFPEINADGELENIVCICRDITERLKSEEEMQKLEKLESLGLMAGGIAHDFNNILTMLFGNIALAKSDISQSSPAFEELENAEEAFFRASRLTNQLLTFAKGGSPIRKKIRLNKVIEDVAKFDISGSKVKLKLEVAADLQDAYADQAQLEQVFTNLVINAVQSMPGGGLLTIRASNQVIEAGGASRLEPGSYIKIEFEDEGEGIPHEVMDRIFDPYFSTKKNGSGLGLATVYSVISKHQGTVEVDSLPGKGARFSVILPVSQVSASITEKQKNVIQNNPGMKYRILVMDDERMIRKLCATMLRRAGYLVEVAEGGEQAIGLYKQALDEGRAFDCVIMDLTVPGGIGGKEAIREILKIDPHARVIVSSGYSDDKVMAEYSKFGFKGVLPKPFTAGMMQEVIASALQS